MNTPKTKITNKKFYNKWLYKVSLKVNGAGIFRSRSLDLVKEFCLSDHEDHRSYTFTYRCWQYRDEILRLATFLEKNSQKEWTKRIETKIIDFYTNDPEFYEDLSTEFDDWLIHKFEPSEDSSTLLDSASSIVVSKLPHNKYLHRVYLLPHKLAYDVEAKKKYIEWLKSQGERVTCTPAVEKWFLTTDWNWDRRYILVDNEKTLLMLKLRNPEVMGRVYNFVLSDK